MMLVMIIMFKVISIRILKLIIKVPYLAFTGIPYAKPPTGSRRSGIKNIIIEIH